MYEPLMDIGISDELAITGGVFRGGEATTGNPGDTPERF